MNASALPLLVPATPDAVLDVPGGTSSAGQDAAQRFGSVLGTALSGASSALERADDAERAFAAGHGNLQAMVLERAQADVALSIATAAASRTTQALSTILGMQI